MLVVIACVACDAREPTRRFPSNTADSRSAPTPSRDVVALVLAARRAREVGYECTPAFVFPPLPHQTIGITLDPVLTAAAQAKADAIARGAEFSHGEGDDDAEPRARRLGYEPDFVGELLAKGTPSPEATVRSWVQSPGHCRLLLSPRANEIGAGHARDGRGADVWVVELGEDLR